MKIELIIRECPYNGFLGGPIKKELILNSESQNEKVKISVEQLGERTIAIFTNSSMQYANQVYFDLKRLLMLFDGHFYPIVSACENGTNVTASIVKRLISSYHSADFTLGTESKLIDFSQVLSEQLFTKWHELQVELDIIHKMVLYCLSDAQIPVDMKCAFLIEAFSGVGELIERKKDDFTMPQKERKDQSELRMRLEYIIEHYGQVIFRDEIQKNIIEFTQILTNSRNRIAHIKSKQEKTYLDGKESVYYLCKLSLMYRMILFDLLGIPYELYEAGLLRGIKYLNGRWENIKDEFFTKKLVPTIS